MSFDNKFYKKAFLCGATAKNPDYHKDVCFSELLEHYSTHKDALITEWHNGWKFMHEKTPKEKPEISKKRLFVTAIFATAVVDTVDEKDGEEIYWVNMTINNPQIIKIAHQKDKIDDNIHKELTNKFFYARLIRRRETGTYRIDEKDNKQLIYLTSDGICEWLDYKFTLSEGNALRYICREYRDKH